MTEGNLKHSIKIGFSFGLTSSVITILGLLVGLHASTGSRSAILGGILIIAIADAMSDALGIHVSEENEGVHTHKEVWFSTFSTFFTKFLVSLTFVVPFLIFDLFLGVVLSIIWGLVLLGGFTYLMAKKNNKNPLLLIIEHTGIAITVIIISHYVGDWAKNIFV